MDSDKVTKELILFADDSKTARAAATKVLQKKYHVIEAVDGESAWAHIQDNPDIDLVFSDIHMPVSNGFELLNNIRKSEDARISNLPVIIITGVENSEAAMRVAINMGATDFISKPFKGIDMLCRTHSYITLYRKIKTLEARQEEAVSSFDILKTEESYGSDPAKKYDGYARKYLSLANRHKISCAFASIEVEILNDIHMEYSNATSSNIQHIISTRLDRHLREEDFFVQLGINRFGLILPMTSQLKSQILLLRFVDTINAMVLDIKEKKYRLSAKAAVYSCTGSGNKLDHIHEQLEEAIVRSRNSSGKILICEDNRNEAPVVKEEEDTLSLSDSLLHVLNGDYNKIVDGHVKELSERLGPFLNFADTFAGQAVVDIPAINKSVADKPVE